MPYFIYRISAQPLTLEYIDVKDQYQEARALVRGLRSQQPDAEPESIRMIFARTPAEAERLLSQPRDDRVIGED